MVGLLLFNGKKKNCVSAWPAWPRFSPPSVSSGLCSPWSWRSWPGWSPWWPRHVAVGPGIGGVGTKSFDLKRNSEKSHQSVTRWRPRRGSSGGKFLVTKASNFSAIVEAESLQSRDQLSCILRRISVATSFELVGTNLPHRGERKSNSNMFCIKFCNLILNILPRNGLRCGSCCCG